MILPTDLFLAGFLSFFIGILSAILGLGGGFLLVPMYTLLFGLDPVLAIGTSITTTIFTAGSASVSYARNGLIQYPLVTILITGSIPAALLGSYMVGYLPGNVICVLFAAFLLVISLQMAAPVLTTISSLLRKPGATPYPMNPGITATHLSERWYFLFWGVIGGLSSGLTGISAGTVFVPVLFKSGIKMTNAAAISLAAIIFTSSGAAIVNILLGHISIPFFIFSAGGVTLGAMVGVRISRNLHQELIRYAFSLTMLVIAFLMFNKGLSGIF